MVRDGEYVAIFNSIHRVMKAEKLLKGLSLPVLLIPAPRALTSDCGLAIRYDEPSRKEVECALSEAALLPEDTYRKSGEEFVRVTDNFLP
jgi:hypothetical protein